MAELAAIKEQLAGTAAASGQLSDEAVQKIDIYSAEVQGLRAEMGTLQDKVSGLATRIDEVAANADREIATAQTRVGEIETQAATALGAAETDAAVALMRAAMASGQPFAEPLAKLAGDPGVTVPEGLTAAAATGVQTLAQLRDSYPDAAHAAIRASIMAGAGDGRRRAVARLPRGAGGQPVADPAGGNGRRTRCSRAWRTGCAATTSRACWPIGGAAVRGRGGDERLARRRAAAARGRGRAGRARRRAPATN